MLCIRPQQPAFGLMDIWQQNPISYSGATPSGMANSLQWQTLDDQGVNSRSERFEFGWESRYDNLPDDRAYWLEQDATSFNYRTLEGVPGGSGSDGRLHTYMVVPGEGSQLELYFDFNPVATTTKAEGTRIGESSGGLVAETIEAATFTGPFEHRMQLLDGNHVWRRPWAAETSTREIYPCDAPRNAPATGGPNTPPRCLNASIIRGANATVDYFQIDKPSPAALQTNPSRVNAVEATGSFNGVDQQALAGCMALDPSHCMKDVAGLAACVAAHKACNITGLPAQPDPSAKRTAMMSEKQALQLARKSLVVSGGGSLATASARTVSAEDYAVATGDSTLKGTDGNVIVVTGNEPVQRLLGRPTERYRGYRLVFDTLRGALISACLGSCPGAR
ncbi:hypothetical protein [Micromonospora sp. NPDC050695]|uniref:hypothetical protein n=1 Tax=Micromonospora sp. NPDC050695 TaxID=3154938 RepID=UPI0033CF36DF